MPAQSVMRDARGRSIPYDVNGNTITFNGVSEDFGDAYVYKNLYALAGADGEPVAYWSNKDGISSLIPISGVQPESLRKWFCPEVPAVSAHPIPLTAHSLGALYGAVVSDTVASLRSVCLPEGPSSVLALGLEAGVPLLVARALLSLKDITIHIVDNELTEGVIEKLRRFGDFHVGGASCVTYAAVFVGKRTQAEGGSWKFNHAFEQHSEHGDCFPGAVAYKKGNILKTLDLMGSNLEYTRLIGRELFRTNFMPHETGLIREKICSERNEYPLLCAVVRVSPRKSTFTVGDCQYLNNGSYGNAPILLREEQRRWQHVFDKQLWVYFQGGMKRKLKEQRDEFAKFVGVDDSSQIALCMNATYGLNVAIRTIAEKYLKAGDEVLYTNHEYGSIERTWEYYSSKGFHIKIHEVPLPCTTAEAFTQSFIDSITPRTKVVMISEITSPTGLYFPIRGIVAHCRAKGILTVIDGAHCPGQVPIDIGTLDCDFYAGNIHKWLYAPYSVAFLYMRREHIDNAQPAMISWGYKVRPHEKCDSLLVDLVELQGTRDISNYFTIEDAILFHKNRDWQTAREESKDICKKFAYTMKLALGIETPLVQEGSSWPWAQQMSCASVPADTDLTALKARLWDVYQLELPQIDWNGLKMMRVSVHVYNTQEEIDTLERALVESVPICKVGGCH